jgi:hypothetical protein
MRPWSTLVAVSVLTLAAASCGTSESAVTTSTPGVSTTALTTTSLVTTVPTTTGVATTVPGTTAPGTTVPGTSVPGTSVPVTTVPVTTVPVTTVPGTSTTVACEFTGATTDRRDSFPERMTSMVGVDIRTGTHSCYERIVIELADSTMPTPGGMPGWWVRYADGPITLGQTDDQFVEVEGDATLLISMNAWMPSMDGEGWVGSTDIFPTNVTHVLELRQIDNWEGQNTWAIGIDTERPFRVFTLASPSRLVVDIRI